MEETIGHSDRVAMWVKEKMTQEWLLNFSSELLCGM